MPKITKTKNDDTKSTDLAVCSICCSNFNFSINSKSICPHCNIEICKKCIMTYLLSSIKDPHCMNCKNYWSQEILQNLTSKSFRTGEYKNHRQNILMDREKGFLQLALPYVDDTRKSRLYWELFEKYNQALTIINEKKVYLQKLHDHLDILFLDYKKFNNQYEVKGTVDENKIEVIKKYGYDLLSCINLLGENDKLIETNDKIKNLLNKPKNYYEKILKEQFPFDLYSNFSYKDYTKDYPFSKKVDNTYKFNTKCRNEDCRGFLNDKWICVVCSHLTCKHCLVCLGEIKNLEKPNDEKAYLKKIHGCKPEDIETANLIKKDSKPCPKCQTLIYRIDGCLQMFCTYCKTAFDWKTGEIATKGIHNPHYFQWKNGKLKEFGKDASQLEDTHLECCENNGFLEIGLLNCNIPIIFNSVNIMGSKINFISHGYFNPIVALRNHYHNVVLRDFRNENNENIHENEIMIRSRVKYLLNEISEEEWKSRIHILENKTLRISEIRQLIELFLFVSGETLLKFKNNLENFNKKYNLEDINKNEEAKERYINHIIELLTEMSNLIIYVDEQFEKLQDFYNVIIPYFNDKFIEFSKRFKDIIEKNYSDLNKKQDAVINFIKSNNIQMEYNFLEVRWKRELTKLKKSSKKLVKKDNDTNLPDKEI